jgi:NhaP-type Na+/H+ and K+/H+ antiporter
MVLDLSPDFVLHEDALVADLEEFYGVRVGADANTTLGDLLRWRLEDRLAVGRAVIFDGVALMVLELAGDRVTRVGVTILPQVGGDAGTPAG